MTWTISAIPEENLTTIWPIVVPMLRPPVKMSGGRVTMATLFRGLVERRSQLWVAHQEDQKVMAAFVTRVAQYPARRLVTVDCVGGTGMELWVSEAQATFRRYAADMGCSGVELAGRIGWARVLAPYGWTRDFAVMTVDVASKGSEK